ncbi:desulfoferrodoxin [Firmicutes bacterium M10-2]|nr:desulfoferrodoxin [Firmicutes bacterium M10-2]
MKLFKGKKGEVVEVLNAPEEITLTVNGEPMVELKAGSTDAALEKHVPAVKKEGEELFVQVGEIEHPMAPEHFITNIWVEYPDGSVKRQSLIPGEKPTAVFDVKDVNGKVTVYEYCNLHGLWKKEIDL